MGNITFYDQMILYAENRKCDKELRARKLTDNDGNEIGKEKLNYEEEINDFYHDIK